MLTILVVAAAKVVFVVACVGFAFALLDARRRWL